MATEDDHEKNPAVSKEKFDFIMNKVAVAYAKHEEIVNGWMAKWGHPVKPQKTMEELAAEDAILFRPQPSRSAATPIIPAKYLVKGAERYDKDLRAKLLPTKGLHASKARDNEEKAASAKRALNEQSSDEEEGRSGLGRAKKRKVKPAVLEPADAEDVPMHTVSEIETPEPKARVYTAMDNSVLDVQRYEARSGLATKKNNRKPESPSPDHTKLAAKFEGQVNQASEEADPQELTVAFKTPSKSELQDDKIRPSSSHEPNGMHPRKKPGDESEQVSKARDPKDVGTDEAVEPNEEMRKKALKKEKKRQKKKEKKDKKRRERAEPAGSVSSD